MMLDQSSQWYKLQYPECFVSEEQRMTQKLCADFCDNEIMPVRSQIDDDITHEEIIRPILKKLLVDLGLQKNPIPKEYGGNQMLSAVANVLKNEQISRGDYGISISADCSVWPWIPACIAYYAPSPEVQSPEAKAWGKAILDEFAGKFTGNELQIGCFNMSEPQSAIDIENLTNEGRTVQTRARLEGDEWVINGSKMWASNSGIADLNLVICNMDPSLGLDAFTLVYVPEPWSGVSHGKFEVKCGVQSDRNTSTYFDDVRVPIEWGLQGPVAWRIFKKAFVTGYPFNAANAVGVMGGAFETLLDYTGQKVVGGKIINQHYSSAMIIGEMATVIDICRAAVLELAYEYDHPEIYGESDTETMIARAHAIHAFVTKSAQEQIAKGMELMGAFGYARANNYEKYYRDIAVAKLVVGSVQVGYLGACRPYYDLDISSFGTGKLEDPVKKRA
jgi:alkylation response protein AidB-like acyl-CoA dehydrogenase